MVIQQSPAKAACETAGDGQFPRTGPSVDVYDKGYGRQLSLEYIDIAKSRRLILPGEQLLPTPTALARMI
jgi:hypothetical protein